MNISPSTRAWIRVHIIYPLIPYFLETIIRFAIIWSDPNNSNNPWEIFSAATLAISIGFICFFVAVSLFSGPLLSDKDERERIYSDGFKFVGFAIFCVGLFTVMVLISSLQHKLPPIDKKLFIHLNNLIKLITILILVFTISFIRCAVRAQQSYKLRVIQIW